MDLTWNFLKDHENLVAAALACISTLALRVKENSKTLFETGLAENVVEAMRLYPKNKIILVSSV